MKSLMIIFLAAAVMLGQSSTMRGTLRGIVTDPSGAAIPAASVMVTGPNFIRTVATDETGQYVITGLLPGHYTVQVYSPGFAPLLRSGLVLSAGYGTEADAQLSIKTSRQ